jgi:dCTP deaminase
LQRIDRRAGAVYDRARSVIHTVSPAVHDLVATLVLPGLTAFEPTPVYQPESRAEHDGDILVALGGQGSADRRGGRALMAPHVGLLVDRDLRKAARSGDLVITDVDWSLLRSAAISLRLGTGAYVPTSQRPVDVACRATYPRLVERPPDAHGRIVVRPGEVLLVRTLEAVGLSTTLAGLLDGTSNLARLGISVVLAHQVSPGGGMPYGAPLTLEIVSRLRHDAALRPGMRIANLMVFRGRRARRSYAQMPNRHPSSGWSVRSRPADLFDAP